MVKLTTTSALRDASLISAALLLGGCRICADCEDAAYPAYGGSWQRTIRNTGRVGSLFDPAGAKAFDLASRDEPEGADELERERYKARGSAVKDPDETEEELERESESIDDSLEEQKLRDREDELRDRKLEDIDNPKEKEQQQKELDEIDVRVIQGAPAPPIL
jgi:hypothetical protein